MGTPVRLVLWDVDHTLIETRGVGREVFAVAFEQATGRPMERMPEITGRTEPDIFEATARLHGIAYTAELFEEFADLLANGYAARADEMRHRGCALPGAPEALEALAETGVILQSVLTGNTRRVAEIKLDTFDLGRLVDFEAGAYGSDDPSRPNLVAIAQRRAASRYGIAFDRHTTVLIGDSPGDVETGRVGGARVIAVASGKSTLEDLTNAGAELAVPNLTNAQSLAKTVLG